MKNNFLKRKFDNEFELVQITAKDFKFFMDNLTLEKSDLESMKLFINKFGYKQIAEFLKYESNKDLSLLNVIANKGHSNLLKYLIENSNAQVNASFGDRLSTMNYAIQNKEMLNFNYLLDREKKYQPNAYQYVIDSLLSSAIKSNNIELFEFMLKEGANTASIDINGYTPLTTAVFYNNIKMVKLLFENGANIKSTYNNGFDAIGYAAKNGYLELIKLLIQHGAIVDLLNDEINYIYFDKSFNVEEFIDDEYFHGDLSFEENHPIIRNLLLAVFRWQTILSGGLNNLLHHQPFVLNLEIKDLFKNFFNNKLKSAIDFKEICSICRSVISSKDNASNFLKSFNNKFNSVDDSFNNVMIYEELIEEIIQEVITLIYGEDRIFFNIPNLSILTLIKILSNSKDLMELFKTNPFAIDKAKTAIKTKLVNAKQETELNFIFAKISADEVNDNLNFENRNYHVDPKIVIGSDIDIPIDF